MTATFVELVSLAEIRAEVERVRSAPPLNIYRGMSTAHLVTERECWSWDLAELNTTPGAPEFIEENAEWIAFHIEQADSELARRRRLYHVSGAPKPSHMPNKQLLREQLDEIKERVSLGSFIEGFTTTKLERRAGDYWCSCPLPGHDDTTPSFHLDERGDLFYCFGCHRGGDLFEFVRQWLGVDEFRRAVDFLRVVAGIEAPKPIAQRAANRPRPVVV